MSEDFAARVHDVEEIVAQQDRWRLSRTVNLIASENVLSRRARALMTSDFQHRYAEGHPGKRYYNGTKHIDEIETLAVESMKTLFRCTHAEVRTISGTQANDVVFSSLLREGDLVLVNALPAGGHISHHAIGSVGKYTRRIEFLPVTADGFTVDVAAARDKIATEMPRLVVLGRSLILFPEPVREIAEACQESGTTLVYDGAHVLGLIAGGQFQDPLREGAVYLNGSTHKTFFGPQRGVILSNADPSETVRIDRAAFPGATSNHHLHTLPPLLVSLYEMLSFGGEYAAQVIRNAKALASALDKRGVPVCMRERGYTESHQMAVDVSSFGGGRKIAKRLEKSSIIVNKNMIPGDKATSPHDPSGIRVGAQEMTRWGMREEDFEEFAELMAACIKDDKDVNEEVRALRGRFLEVHYSFDEARVPSIP